MSGTDSTAARTLEELEALMESAFQTGDVGETALLCWESMARFPENSAVARIFTKKLLRDPEVAGTSLESFTRNAKELREAGETLDLAKLTALGLLRFPAQRYLTISLVDAAEKMGRQEWIRPAVESLGEPEKNDVVLNFIHATFELRDHKFERALARLEVLREQQPNNADVLSHYCFALIGVNRRLEAIALLEENLPSSSDHKRDLMRLLLACNAEGIDAPSKLEQLDRAFFGQSEQSDKLRVHADIRLVLQDFRGYQLALEKLYDTQGEPEIAFELAEVQLANGAFEAGFSNYAQRFEAIPSLAYRGLPTKLPRYQGQRLTSERLLLLSDQGVGDEILFATFFQALSKRVENVTAVVDKRLAPYWKALCPNWEFLDRFGSFRTDFDFHLYTGDLMSLFLNGVINGNEKIKHPLVRVADQSVPELELLDAAAKAGPVVGISWRGGGQNLDAGARSLELRDFMRGSEMWKDVTFVSLQYDGDHEAEIYNYGDSRIVSTGIDNRNDLGKVFQVLNRCDAVFSVDNSVAHFGCAVGLPTAVLLPAARVQFRWMNENIRRMLLPSSFILRQHVAGDWSGAVKAGWEYLRAATEANS